MSLPCPGKGHRSMLAVWPLPGLVRATRFRCPFSFGASKSLAPDSFETWYSVARLRGASVSRYPQNNQSPYLPIGIPSIKEPTMQRILCRSVFVLCLCFSSDVFAGVSDNAELISAIEKYYETVDRAKLVYENELRKVLANTQKAGNLMAYNAIEAELKHTIGKTGHCITKYEPPRNSSLYTKKATLKKAVDVAQSEFKKIVDKISSDLLKEGNVDEARDVATIAKSSEPPRFYIEKNINIAAKKEIKPVEAIIYPLSGGRQLFQVKLSKQLVGRQGRVNQAEWSQDGTIIASSGKDHYAAIWDARSGKMLSALNSATGSGGGVLLLSNDNKQVFFGGTSGEVGLWNFTKNKIVWKKKVDTWVTNFALSPDGKILCLCTRGGLSILEAATGNKIRSLEGHKGYLLRACFFDNGNRLITSSQDNVIIVWDTKTWQPVARPTEHSEAAYGVALSPDNSIIATGSYDDTVVIWDAKTLKPIQKLGEFKKDAIALAFSPNGKFLAVGQNNGETVVLAVKTWEPVFVAPAHGVWSTKITWSPDGRFLVTCGDDIRVWEMPLSR